MNTNVDTSLEYFLSVVEDIEEPCEHTQHEKLPDYHSGAGKWYVTSVACDNCSKPESTKLICDKFVKTAIFGGTRFYCYICKMTIGHGMEAFVSLVRKG